MKNIKKTINILCFVFVFVSCSVIKQQPNIPVPDDYFDYINTCIGCGENGRILQSVSLYLNDLPDSIVGYNCNDCGGKIYSFDFGKSMLDTIKEKPLYDTTYGLIEIISRSGGIVRGLGFKIDSLYTYSYMGGVDVPFNYGKPVTTTMQLVTKFNTIKTTLKVFFEPCGCYINTKKYFNFIPINDFQNISILKDEGISISDN